MNNGRVEIGCQQGKRVLFLFLIILLISAILPLQSAFAAQSNIYLNGRALEFSQQPQQINGHTVVPFRVIAEGIGIQVHWDAQNRTVIANGGGKEIRLIVGQTEALVNNERYSLGVAPFVADGTTLIPLRFFSEQFGATVHWDANTGDIHISATTQPADLYTFTFYGLGSFEHRHYLPLFDGVAFTWSRINARGEWTDSSANQNEFFWPQPHPEASTQDLIQTVRQGGEAYLMVAAFEDRGEVSALLHSEERKAKAIEQMVHKADSEGMDGVLIDFEGISMRLDGHAELTHLFTAFLKQLQSQLTERGLKLAVALPPPNNYFNGYDYERIGQIADWVYLMAHDYNPRGEGNHRIPEPLNLVDAGVRQSLEHIPADKLVLGINIIYETPETTIDKIDIAQKYQLKGVGFWLIRGLNDERIDKINERVKLGSAS